MSEIQRLKQQLEAMTQSDAACAKQCEFAESELEGLRQEMELRLATIEGLKVNIGESDKAAYEANAVVAEAKQQLETAKATIDSLLSEGARLQECLRLKDVGLGQSKAQVSTLEEDLKKAKAAGNGHLKNEQDNGNFNGRFGSPDHGEALEKVVVTMPNGNGSCGGSGQEIEQLRTAFEVAEIRYQEEQTRMMIETKTTYEMLENAKSGYECRVRDLELQLKSKNDDLTEVKAALAIRSDGKSEMIQPELEAKLMKSITDMTEMKASLMDKETALQSMMEENETLKSDAGKEAAVQRRYEAAVAELELAKVAEQDIRMRLGYVTEEADQSSRRAARALEQLDAAQAAGVEMEAELRRLRVQSDQWRKAAEAAAVVLGGEGGDGRGVVRTGLLEPAGYSNSMIGGKLASSPFSDEPEEESPKRRNSGVLRRMSGLWKKSPK
ncbi:hypothetical protein GUJ93_ZPchr0005g15786 [Zizania palustris]|nr:hypothetical protein GUJ93_ZPchr0005g15786 [Zizania palustris]